MNKKQKNVQQSSFGSGEIQGDLKINFQAPVFGIAGNVEGNQNINTLGNEKHNYMSFISQIQRLLVVEKQVYNLSRNEEFVDFNFIGFKETAATIDFVAFVKADNLTESKIVNLRDSFFNITQIVSYDFGLKSLGRKPNGLLCFVFEDSLPNHLANFVKKQTKISNFTKEAVIVSWAIDVKRKKIYTHNNPVSVLPPVWILEGLVFPGLDYLNS
ncbi:MAG: hypothetical protein AAGA80_25525, partial [Cyanobacteria bacterium P01_F01_bin.143]